MSEASSSQSRAGIALASTFVIAVAVVWAATTLGNSFVRGRADTDMIKVTGSARREIKSDFVIWRGKIGYRGTSVEAVYSDLKAASDKAVDYLTGHGISREEITVKAANLRTLYASNPGQAGYQGEDTFRTVQGYEINQTIEVSSKNVDKVESVSRSISELIATGVAMDSEPPQYIYTKIGDVKVEILSEAAKDARRRAEEIAKASGGTISGVRSARMSPLQISPVYDYAIVGEGQNDTANREKAITAIVTMTFGVR